jgi:UDP-N-acetyl-D-mannosaminouronate:lipid I N-acetyl-D-mannosaminouronosyltransferase
MGSAELEQSEVSIGGIPVGLFTGEHDVIASMLTVQSEKGSCVAVAINPEKVMAAHANPELKTILQQCDLRYADGIGVVKAIGRKSGHKIARIPGCELWEALMKTAGQRQLPVFLVGARPEVITQAKAKLARQYQTPVVDHQDGYFDDESELIERIKASGAKVVTVAMGSPKQEQFIFRCREAGVQAVFMGVGGTYDVYTGNVKRAPAIFCKLGLEWLYRLLAQPTRIGRQLSLLRFAWLMLRGKL